MMKKIILFFMLLTPFFFFGCQDAVEEVTGKMDVTINGEAHSFPMATFVRVGDYTTITSTNVSNTVTIAFKGSSKGTYELGVGTDLLTAIANISHINSAENALLYFPISNSDDAFASLFGNLTISEYSTDKITGSFSGTGISKNLLEGITGSQIDTIVNLNNKMFAGTFTAVAYGL
jgi:hypothetical protein